MSDEGESASAVRVCADCGKTAPMTQTAHTLIRAHGWRLSVRDSATGRVVEWRCRDCWRKLKASKGA